MPVAAHHHLEREVVSESEKLRHGDVLQPAETLQGWDVLTLDPSSVHPGDRVAAALFLWPPTSDSIILLPRLRGRLGNSDLVANYSWERTLQIKKQHHSTQTFLKEREIKSLK